MGLEEEELAFHMTVYIKLKAPTSKLMEKFPNVDSKNVHEIANSAR